MARRKKITRKTVKKAKVGGLGDFLNKLPAQDWFDFASQQRGRLIKEINHLSGEILNRIAESNIFSNRDDIINDARDHLDSIVSRLNQSELLSKVIHAARGTKNEILSFLNIPSSKELSSLQKRLNQLEKRITTARSRTRS